MRFVRFLVILLCIGAFANSSFGRKYEFQGAGGFLVGMYNPDLGFLHDKIQEVTPKFDKIDSPIITGGGFGYGQVSDHCV